MTQPNTAGAVGSYPIILTAAEVRAVLNGTKTQHRVRVKFKRPSPWQIMDEGDDGKPWPFYQDEFGDYHPMRCPFGVPGDRLWVRETFAECGRQVVYRADNPDGYPGANFQPWRSPLAMPRHLSRLTLEVESVRVQRLQDISEEDARAEGVEQCGGFMTHWGCWMNYGRTGPSFKTARDSYRSLWQVKHNADSWSRNDWVFATTFKRVSP